MVPDLLSGRATAMHPMVPFFPAPTVPFPQEGPVPRLGLNEKHPRLANSDVVNLAKLAFFGIKYLPLFQKSTGLLTPRKEGSGLQFNKFSFFAG